MYNPPAKISYKISPVIIWLSSLFIGILVSIPQIAGQHFNFPETLTNSVVTFLFTLFVWYFNIYMFPAHTSKQQERRLFIWGLLRSILLGLVIMLLLTYVQQLIWANSNIKPDFLMVQVRGIFVNITFYIFLHLLYQNYQYHQAGMEQEHIRADIISAHYETLKQQINPHFLFNSMDVLKTMVETNDKRAVEYVLKLAVFYRFTLESRKHDLIHLSDEVDMLTVYMFLLKAHFEDGINLVNRIDSKYQKTLIPPFTMQLIIENCIKHNIVSLNPALQIAIYTQDEEIIIENPIQLKTSQESAPEIGLENINQRYMLFLDQNIHIEADEKYFKVKLPVINEQQHHGRREQGFALPDARFT